MTDDPLVRELDVMVVMVIAFLCMVLYYLHRQGMV